ncbi:MAG: phosphohistidine phosphatase SixA [Armatimonadota bacterium]|nr:phosphohistidine phosphatase SixA [Armatimonadota bacterium]
MRLYLVQHAEAKREDEDPARPLTEKGWQDARKVAQHAVGRAGVRPGRILHSGKLRAQQTAEVWAAATGGMEIAAAEGLDPTAAPAVWAERLARESGDLMLVGHLPHLGRLASLLLCGDADSQVVRFETGGIVCLERGPDGRWSLRWAITPGTVGS